MTVELTLGCKRYPWIEPLIRDHVTPSGIDLTVVDDRISPAYFTGILDRDEFDLAELSLGAYLATLERPEYDVTALPVFPHRRFRHSSLYVQAGADIEAPSDLNGATIGMVNWSFAAGLWLRGILGERHGLDLRTVDWRLAGSDPVPVAPGDDFSLTSLEWSSEETLEEGGSGALRALEQALASGALDAVITPTEYHDDNVRRLFSDPFSQERDYYKRTGIFPIMHVIAIRERLVADKPWIANTLYDAFSDSLAAQRTEMREPGRFKLSPLVWSLESMEMEHRLFDDNPWEYGLTDRNRRTLEKGIEYAIDQRLIEERCDIEALFVEGVGQ